MRDQPPPPYPAPAYPHPHPPINHIFPGSGDCARACIPMQITGRELLAYFVAFSSGACAERKYAPCVVFAASSGFRRRPTQVCLLQCFFNNLIRKPKIRTHHSCEVSLPPFAERRLNDLVLLLVRWFAAVSLRQNKTPIGSECSNTLPISHFLTMTTRTIPHCSFQIAQCVGYKRLSELHGNLLRAGPMACTTEIATI